jgi:hypothetical protein
VSAVTVSSTRTHTTPPSRYARAQQ